LEVITLGPLVGPATAGAVTAARTATASARASSQEPQRGVAAAFCRLYGRAWVAGMAPGGCIVLAPSAAGERPLAGRGRDPAHAVAAGAGSLPGQRHLPPHTGGAGDRGSRSAGGGRQAVAGRAGQVCGRSCVRCPPCRPAAAPPPPCWGGQASSSMGTGCYGWRWSNGANNHERCCRRRQVPRPPPSDRRAVRIAGGEGAPSCAAAAVLLRTRSQQAQAHR
jgi:hypothetical protein